VTTFVERSATPTVLGAGSFVGSPVRRVEDPTLLTGAARYVDDLPLTDACHLAFVRSPYAHAKVLEVRVEAARAMPGVVAVYTGADLGLAPFGFFSVNPAVPRPVLAVDEVQFVGDPVAVVVATSKVAALDAVDLVEVDYDPLPAVLDMEAALAADAPTLFGTVESNLMAGSADGIDDVLAGADVVVRGRFENQRMAVVPMEGAAVAVLPTDDGDGHELTVYLACQMPHMMRMMLAQVLALEEDRIRLVSPHVGGSFGAKHLAVEALAAVKIARDLGRPVKWVELRSENMVSMTHGRGQVQYVELGVRLDGTIVGMRCRMVGDAGAYGCFGGSLVLATTRSMVQGTYVIPKISYDVAVAATNTTPMGAYRGAGRPEACALVERIVDMAADALDIDPVEMRRRNLIAPDAFPYTTSVGTVYDSGNYVAALDEALRLAGYDELRAEQAARRARGDRVQLGIGVSCYVEITAGGMLSEYAGVEVHADGSATVRSGTSAHGQGHATAFTQIAADELGIPIERIRFVQSDTALVPRGGGTGGSRSLQLGGSAVLEGSRVLLDRAKHLAANLLEAAPEDIVVSPGRGLAVAGVPATVIPWEELAAQADAQGVSLAVDHDATISGPSFPFGAHVSAVEVDLDTGLAVPIRHIAVDDCGRIVNPLLVDGQVHGGIASGISQALWEQFVYDEDGSPLTTTLADYAVPSAAELPSFELANTVTLSPNNSLGAKGIGESATVGSTPAVQNAVVDALSHLGIRHIDMPCTPARVWAAVQAAEAGAPPDPWREPPPFFATLPVTGGGVERDDLNL
jgi:carbon-monoxide dehydrogenase large subunit